MSMRLNHPIYIVLSNDCSMYGQFVFCIMFFSILIYDTGQISTQQAGRDMVVLGWTCLLYSIIPCRGKKIVSIVGSDGIHKLLLLH